MTHPKGGMCMACKHLKEDCSKLPFDKMPAHAQDKDGNIIVICTSFIRRAISM